MSKWFNKIQIECMLKTKKILLLHISYLIASSYNRKSKHKFLYPYSFKMLIQFLLFGNYTFCVDTFILTLMVNLNQLYNNSDVCSYDRIIHFIFLTLHIISVLGGFAAIFALNCFCLMFFLGTFYFFHDQHASLNFIRIIRQRIILCESTCFHKNFRNQTVIDVSLAFRP